MSDNVRYKKGYVSANDILWKCKDGHVFIHRGDTYICPICGTREIHRV